jgi:hypothetical protein
MALGSTHALTEMSSWGVNAAGAQGLNILETVGPFEACAGIALLY